MSTRLTAGNPPLLISTSLRQAKPAAMISYDQDCVYGRVWTVEGEDEWGSKTCILGIEVLDWLFRFILKVNDSVIRMSCNYILSIKQLNEALIAIAKEKWLNLVDCFRTKSKNSRIRPRYALPLWKPYAPATWLTVSHARQAFTWSESLLHLRGWVESDREGRISRVAHLHLKWYVSHAQSLKSCCSFDV